MFDCPTLARLVLKLEVLKSHLDCQHVIPMYLAFSQNGLSLLVICELYKLCDCPRPPTQLKILIWKLKIASWSSSKAIITDRNINLLELQSNQTPKDNHKTLSRSTRLKEWALAVYVLPAVHSMSHKTHQKLFKFNCIGINIQESFKSTPPPRA